MRVHALPGRSQRLTIWSIAIFTMSGLIFMVATAGRPAVNVATCNLPSLSGPYHPSDAILLGWALSMLPAMKWQLAARRHEGRIRSLISKLARLQHPEARLIHPND